MAFLGRRCRFIVLMLLMMMAFFVGQKVFAQGSPGISVEVRTAVPTLSVAVTGSNAIDVFWDWDFIAPGHVPTQVSQVDVELSTDGVNFVNLQSHAPTDFLASYIGLAVGTYTARVTVLDGNDFSYLLGPVVLSAGDVGRLNRPGTGSPGLIESSGESQAVVRIEGLAYPGPISQVTVGIQNVFSTILSPNADGSFTLDGLSLPAGVLDFFVSARDADGQLSALLQLSQDIAEEGETLVGRLYLAPTVRVLQERLVRGEPIQLRGYAYPNGKLKLEFYDARDDLLEIQEVAVDGQGRWEYDGDSSLLEEGFYGVKARAENVDGSVLSPPSEEVVFEVLSTFPSAAVCGDGLLMDREECDDANTLSGDGCSASCRLEMDSVPEEEGFPVVDVPDGFEGGVNMTWDGIILKARPEARPDDRLTVAGQLLFFEPGSFAPSYRFDVLVDDDGVAYLNLDDEVPDGVYTMLFKGEAHLSRRLEGVSVSRNGTILMDFTYGGTEELVAGDVHQLGDDFINVLDVMTVLNDLYAGDGLLTDLNKDGLINGLDLAIMALNLYKGGDPLY